MSEWFVALDQLKNRKLRAQAVPRRLTIRSMPAGPRIET
jgi:hypothetical protein